MVQTCHHHYLVRFWDQTSSWSTLSRCDTCPPFWSVEIFPPVSLRHPFPEITSRMKHISWNQPSTPNASNSQLSVFQAHTLTPIHLNTEDSSLGKVRACDTDTGGRVYPLNFNHVPAPSSNTSPQSQPPTPPLIRQHPAAAWDADHMDCRLII